LKNTTQKSVEVRKEMDGIKNVKLILNGIQKKG